MIGYFSPLNVIHIQCLPSLMDSKMIRMMIDVRVGINTITLIDIISNRNQAHIVLVQSVLLQEILIMQC